MLVHLCYFLVNARKKKYCTYYYRSLFLCSQVEIEWDDILQEDSNKGIFDMELENVEDFTDDDDNNDDEVRDGSWLCHRTFFLS